MNLLSPICLTLAISLLVHTSVCSGTHQSEAASPKQYCLGEGCLCKGSFSLYYDFTIDLSFAFKYPVENIGDRLTPAFYYTFSPCDPVVCRNGVKTAAVCQFSKNNNSTEYHSFNCGEVSKASWTIESREKFTVVYGAGDGSLNGDYIRQSMLTFHVNSTSSEPNKIEFLKEEKSLTPEKRLTYYFNVTLNGKHVQG